MKNNFKITGNVTEIYLHSPKYGDMKTIISTNKLVRAEQFTGAWYPAYSKRVGTFYVVGITPMVRGKRETIQLHRWITNAPDGLQVDHSNHDTLDNSDDNLRVITMAENQQNRKWPNRNNASSGIRGVNFDKNSGKWQARININNIRMHLGLFESLNEAEIVVRNARSQHMPYSEDNKTAGV